MARNEVYCHKIDSMIVVDAANSSVRCSKYDKGNCTLDSHKCLYSIITEPATLTDGKKVILG